MDGVLKDGRKGKIWFCNKDNEHALGLVVREHVNNKYVNRLILFRRAVLPQFINSEAKIICVADGDVHDIECTMCDSYRSWWGDKKEAMFFAPLEREKG